MSCSNSSSGTIKPGIVSVNLAHGSENVAGAVYLKRTQSMKLNQQGTKAHYGGRRKVRSRRRRHRVRNRRGRQRRTRYRSRRHRKPTRKRLSRKMRSRTHLYRGGAPSPCGGICGTGGTHAVVATGPPPLKGTGDQSLVGNAQKIQQSLATSKCQALGDKTS